MLSSTRQLAHCRQQLNEALDAERDAATTALNSSTQSALQADLEGELQLKDREIARLLSNHHSLQTQLATVTAVCCVRACVCACVCYLSVSLFVVVRARFFVPPTHFSKRHNPFQQDYDARVSAAEAELSKARDEIQVCLPLTLPLTSFTPQPLKPGGFCL